MSITLGDAITYFRGDTSDVDEKIKGTEKNVSSFGQRIAGAAGKAVGLGIAGAAVGITAITGAIAGSISSANDWAGELDSLGDVLGTNAKESATLAVAIRGVDGDVGAITGQMAKLTKGLTDAKGELGPTGKILTDLGVAFKDANGQMLPAQDIIAGVADKVSQMPDGLDKSKIMMDLFGKSGKDMTDTLAALTSEGLDKAGKKAQEFGLVLSDEAVAASVETEKKMKDLEMAFQGVGVKIGGALLPVLLPLVTKFVEFATTVLPQVADAFKPVVDTIINVAQVVLPEIGKAFEGVISWLQANWPEIQKIVGDVFTAISTIWESVLKPVFSAILTVLGEVLSFVIQHWPEISAAFTRVFNGISDLWNQVLKPVLEFLIAGIGNIVESVEHDLPIIEKTFDDVFNAIDVVWSTVLEPVFAGIGLAINAMVQLVTVEVPKILVVITKVFSDIKKAIDTTINDVKKIWENGWNEIKRVFESVFNSINDIFGGLPKRMLQFGVDALDGFINGLKSMKDRVVEAFIGSLPAALQAFARSLLLQSPSHVMFDFGVDTMQGYIDGLKSMADVPAQVLAGIANSFKAPGFNGVAGMAGAGGKTVNVVINNANTLANGLDVDALAWRLARRIEEY